MASVEQLLKDPGFHKKPLEERLKVLGSSDPSFALLSPGAQHKILFRAEKGALLPKIKPALEPSPGKTIETPPNQQEWMTPPPMSAEWFEGQKDGTGLGAPAPGSKDINLDAMPEIEQEEEFSIEEMPEVEEQGWLGRNASDFIENTPLGIFGQEPAGASFAPSFSQGGNILEETIPGVGIISAIAKSLYGAGEKLFEGDPGAALGQAVTLGAPALMRRSGRGLRSSAEKNMINITNPTNAMTARAQELAPRMLDDYNMMAGSDAGLLKSIGKQKGQRMAYTKPAEQALQDVPVPAIETLQSVGKFLDDQGPTPVGRGADLYKAGERVADEAKNVFFEEVPGTNPSLLAQHAGVQPTPKTYKPRDVRFKNLNQNKQQWGETARAGAAFDKDSPYFDPEMSARGEASRAAFSGAKRTLDDVAVGSGFDQYPKFNRELSDLIDIESMVGRNVHPGTFLGSLPNRVLGWFASTIGPRVLAGELGSRIPGSVPFNAASGYSKNALSKILAEGGSSLTPQEMLLINAMLNEQEGF